MERPGSNPDEPTGKGETNMTKLLEGRRALVTGAGRGIGAAIALKFAEAGADVVLCARSVPQLEEVKARIEKLGQRAVVVPADMGDRGQVLRLADSAQGAFGGIDVIVSNAASSGPFGPLRDVSPDDWRAVQMTNLEGPLTLLQALAPHLIARRSGSVVMIASIRGLNGVPLGAPYAASKAALVSITKSFACELGPFGIRVNAICPGPVDTDMIRDAIGTDPALREKFANLAPLKRWTLAEDCAGPALFLASEESRAITGQELIVDGGLLAQSPEHFLV
jgi:NAD(P)-dependent dehydrogenase (short-subunit alcohol dehydrogenase family)